MCGLQFSNWFSFRMVIYFFQSMPTASTNFKNLEWWCSGRVSEVRAHYPTICSLTGNLNLSNFLSFHVTPTIGHKSRVLDDLCPLWFDRPLEMRHWLRTGWPVIYGRVFLVSCKKCLVQYSVRYSARVHWKSTRYQKYTVMFI